MKKVRLAKQSRPASYSGTLSFVTPLPPGISLLISGLAGLVAWLRWGPVRVLRPAWVA